MRRPQARVTARWLLTVRDAFGKQGTLVLQASRGFVFAQLGDVQVMLSPLDVSDIVTALREAQAEALQQCGGWA